MAAFAAFLAAFAAAASVVRAALTPVAVPLAFFLLRRTSRTGRSRAATAVAVAEAAAAAALLEACYYQHASKEVIELNLSRYLSEITYLFGGLGSLLRGLCS